MLFNSISTISSSSSKVLLSLDNNNTELLMDDNQVHFFSYNMPTVRKNSVVVRYYFKP